MSFKEFANIIRGRMESSIESFQSREHLYLMILAAFIGLLGGLGNLFFQWLIDLIRHFSWGGSDHFVQRFMDAPLYLKIGVPTLGGLAGGLVIRFLAPEAKGHGVPEVMKAVALKDGVIPRRTVIGKTVASALCLATGGSVGREGPIVQIGSALGSALGQLLKLNSVRMKTVVACGATAGIAATFNAPIAGAFFSAEVILSEFGVGYFAPLVISAVVATLVSHAYIGNDPAFIIPGGLSLTDGREILLYALLGLLAAVVGQAFMRSLHAAEDFVEKIKAPGFVLTTAGGLLIGVIGLWAPDTLGNGYEAIEAAMKGEVALGALAILLVVKIVGTSVSLGSGNSGGIFAPSLFMGVMFGGLMGRIYGMAFPDWTAGTGAYALVGMGAVVAAVIHAPITAIIMIFEMTRDYGIILPLMIAVVIATLFSQKMERHSIYTFKLARQGIDLLRGKDRNLLRRLQVGNIMRVRIETVGQATPLTQVLPLLANFVHHEAFVVDEEGKLTGILTLDEVKRALPQIGALGDVLIAHDVALHDPPILRRSDNLDFAMRQFGRNNVEELPVVSDEDPRQLVGTLMRHDVIQAYNKATIHEDLASSLGSRMESSVKSHVTETVGGYVLSECRVPGSMAGKTLAELEFRRRFRTQVLLVCAGGQCDRDDCYALPERDTQLAAGDTLLLFGKGADVARIKNL